MLAQLITRSVMQARVPNLSLALSLVLHKPTTYLEPLSTKLDLVQSPSSPRCIRFFHTPQVLRQCIGWPVLIAPHVQGWGFPRLVSPWTHPQRGVSGYLPGAIRNGADVKLHKTIVLQ